ncbi:MAG: hypothetical protein JZU64_04660 [Rhodoferax sp.]|jgi:ribosomal protein S27AE|nr:hypothetical protein [Rhodoferax sp.]
MTDFHSGATAFEPHNAECPSCGGRYFMDVHWKRTCLKCYLQTKGRTESPRVQVRIVVEPIPADMLKRLVYLVHPDKHANSEASNIATKYLLQLREVQHG